MWVVITRDQCPYCVNAKTLLRNKGLPYVEYNVQSGSSKWILSLLQMADIKTVPQIFLPSGQYMGGYTELKEYIIDGCPQEF